MTSGRVVLAVVGVLFVAAYAALMAIESLVLAVVAAAVGLVRRFSVSTLAMIFLAIVAAGAVPAFGDGIHLGMDIADTYGGTGGAHTIWAGVLYLTSLAAAVGFVGVGVLSRRRSIRPVLHRAASEA